MRLVEFDQSKLTEPERYYVNGLTLVSIDTSKIIPVLRKLWESDLSKPLDNGFFWEQSLNSYTLRPTVYDYDPCFLDFVIDTKLCYDISDITGRNLTLAHIQIMRTTPGRSYQDWHRDTYQFGDQQVVGAMPPAHKVIFYPKFEQTEPRLKYILGSHRTMVNDPKFDEMLVKKYQTDVLGSSNDHALLFETSLLHGVIPDVNPKGSIRIMYSFVEYQQYDRRFAGKENHDRLKKMFEERAYPL